MNSTFSPNDSFSINPDFIQSAVNTDYASQQTSSQDIHQPIPVVIEGSGASWEGYSTDLTRTGLGMIIEGCPLVALSQSIQLHVSSQRVSLQLLGNITAITPKGTAEEGRWARVQLDVKYEGLDDLQWHQLKVFLREASSPFSFSHLEGTLIPLDSGDCLWKMMPATFPENVISNNTLTKVHDKKIFKLQHAKTDSLDVPIVSTPVEIQNSQGQVIRAFYDAPRSPLSSKNPVVIISPGYGESKREYITMAYYFASNGFHVLRYDHTNHVGESDGEHVQTTLSGMRQDLGAVIEYVTARWPESARGIVATSLSGRVALKTVANDVKVDFLYLITPIVDVRHTLQAVHQEDLIASYENKKQKGVTNVLGFNVELDDWLSDAVHGQYSNLETTRQDISRIQIPVVIVSAEHDAWVQFETTKLITEGLGERLQQWVVIPKGLHRILENPKQARAVYRELTRYAQWEVLPFQYDVPVYEPTRKAIGRQNKIEREQKKARELPVELSGFWKDYLDHFHYIVNFSDYQQLLDHMHRLLGPVRNGEKVLDAGCGNGNFGSFLQKKEPTKKLRGNMTEKANFEYVGIDFVPTALQHARKTYQESLMTMRSNTKEKGIPQKEGAYAFHCADLNKPLPFKDGAFDKVVSNLVLGYLDCPAKTIQELMRVLRPGGTLVFTNLKPNSDLSRIFTNFVQETSKTEEIEEAKQLLNNSGKIREAEGEGLFRFPDAQELEELVHMASEGGEPKVFSTFANQAYIVAVTKGSTQEKFSDIPVLNVLKAA